MENVTITKDGEDFFMSVQIAYEKNIKSKIGTIIIISDFIPSLLLFDSLMLIDLFNYLISLI